MNDKRDSSKITLATVKNFIKKNKGRIYIKISEKFDGMIDGLKLVEGEFKLIQETQNHLDYTLGIDGAWFVGSSRDFFWAYEDETLTGIKINNCCKIFTLAVKKISRPSSEKIS